MLYCTALGGLRGGYDDENLIFLAKLAKQHQAKLVLIEKNFGDGMFSQLLKPHLGRLYPCTVEEIHNTGQKEKRIIDILEPVLNQHRLVMDRKVIEADYQSTSGDSYGDRGSVYQAFYQMTRITKDRGSLAKDDRLEALSMAVGYWVEAMARDTDKAAREEREKLDDAALKGFVESCLLRQSGGAQGSSEKSWFTLGV
jgi:hypothetical protein